MFYCRFVVTLSTYSSVVVTKKKTQYTTTPCYCRCITPPSPPSNVFWFLCLFYSMHPTVLLLHVASCSETKIEQNKQKKKIPSSLFYPTKKKTHFLNQFRFYLVSLLLFLFITHTIEYSVKKKNTSHLLINSISSFSLSSEPRSYFFSPSFPCPADFFFFFLFSNLFAPLFFVFLIISWLL